MTEELRAVSLEVTESESTVELRLLANSPRTQEVKYTIEVSGNSKSRHSGKTTLQAGHRQVLSTIRTSNDASWCARLTVEEEGRSPYEIRRGSCA